MSKPKTGIVYVMVHVPSDMFYIGSTFDLATRSNDWLRAISQQSTWTKTLPKKFQELLGQTLLRDWRFFVLRALPNTTNEELALAEQKEIRTAMDRAPERCLNTTFQTWLRLHSQDDN